MALCDMLGYLLEKEGGISMNWRGKRYLEMNMITMNYEIIQKK